MLRIDNSLLQEIGLGSLPDSEKNSLLKHIYDTLEMRVGMRLADQMTNEQLDEFESYYEAKDDQGAFKWLETNFPNYKDIVQEEYDKLKAEIAQSAPQILSASQDQAGQVNQVSGQVSPTNPVAAAMSPQDPQSITSVPAGPTYPQEPTLPTQEQPLKTPPVDPVQEDQTLQTPQPPFPSEQPPAGPPNAS
jgi:hypothetical protein